MGFLSSKKFWLVFGRYAFFFLFAALLGAAVYGARVWKAHVAQANQNVSTASPESHANP